MKERRLTLWGIFALLLFCYPVALSAATNQEKREIIFALDDSGSMKKTDSAGLSKQAAEMFIRLMTPNDQLATVSFSSKAKLIMKPTSMNSSKNKKLAEKKIKTLKRRGARTNIEAPLVNALEHFSENTSSKKALLLLTDGKIDLDNKPGTLSAAESKSRQKILKELLSVYKQRKIPIYTIAFGQDADVDLLKRIALETGGIFFKLDSPKEVTRVYFTIFNQYRSPQLAFVQEGVFTIDTAIKEATLIVQADMQDEDVELHTPSGKINTRSKHSSNIKWGGGASYLMVTIKNPQVGEWMLRGITDEEAKILLLTNIKLKAPARRINYFQDEPIYALAKIDLGKAPGKLLKSLRIFAELIRSNGKVVDSIELKDNGSGDGTCVEGMVDRWYGNYHAGVFSNKYGLETGIYAVRVRASTATFTRERQYSIRIHEGSWLRLAKEKYEVEEDGQLILQMELTNAHFMNCKQGIKQEIPCEVQMPTPLAIKIITPSDKEENTNALPKRDNWFESVFATQAVEGKYKLQASLITSRNSLLCLNQSIEIPFKVGVVSKDDVSLSDEDEQDEKEEDSLFAILGIIAIGGAVVLALIVVYMKKKQELLLAQAELEKARRTPRPAINQKTTSEVKDETQPNIQEVQERLKTESHEAIDDILNQLKSKTGQVEQQEDKPKKKFVDSLDPKDRQNISQDEKEMAESKDEIASEVDKVARKKATRLSDMSGLDKAISRLERKAEVTQKVEEKKVLEEIEKE